eukprot:2921154-Prymnesium_polylepis.1
MRGAPHVPVAAASGGMLEDMAREAQTLKNDLRAARQREQAAAAEAEAAQAQAAARHRTELSRAREEALAARRAGEGRLRALAAEQLSALDETDVEMRRNRKALRAAQQCARAPAEAPSGQHARAGRRRVPRPPCLAHATPAPAQPRPTIVAQGPRRQGSRRDPAARRAARIRGCRGAHRRRRRRRRRGGSRAAVGCGGGGGGGARACCGGAQER